MSYRIPSHNNTLSKKMRLERPKANGSYRTKPRRVENECCKYAGASTSNAKATKIRLANHHHYHTKNSRNFSGIFDFYNDPCSLR